jgi:hypothetical protein
VQKFVPEKFVAARKKKDDSNDDGILLSSVAARKKKDDNDDDGILLSSDEDEAGKKLTSMPKEAVEFFSTPWKHYVSVYSLVYDLFL